MGILIVARYEELLDWTTQSPWPVVVVQKGSPGYPNRGREASTYLRWVEEHYAEILPGRTYGFCQGRPHDHCPDILQQLRSADRYEGLGRVHRCGGDGVPGHAGLPVGATFRDWFGRAPPEWFEFTMGAQFLVPGRVLLSIPLAEHARVRHLVEADDYGPWLMERYWPTYLGEPT